MPHGTHCVVREAARSIAAVVLGALTALPAPADAAGSRVSRDLSNTGALALGLETGGAVVTFATYSIGAGDPPGTCHWCDPAGFDTGLHDALVVGDLRLAATLSHVPPYVLLPVGSLAGLMIPAYAAGEGGHAWENAWMVLNTTLLTFGLTDGTKKLVARQRPAFHYGHEADTEFSEAPKEANLSFFSGDTSIAFELAASGATLAYLRGYATAPWIAAVGGTLALSTAVLRVAAEAHWPSDVLTGAAVGTGVGVGLPLLLHRRSDRRDGVSVQAVPILTGGRIGVVVSGAL